MKITRITYLDEPSLQQHNKLLNLCSWVYVNQLEMDTDLKARLLYLIDREQIQNTNLRGG